MMTPYKDHILELNSLPVHNMEVKTSNGKKTTRQKMISGLRKELVHIAIHSSILIVILKQYKNPIVAYKILRSLIQIRRMVLGDHTIKKVARVDGKYFWDLYTPSYKSKAFRAFIAGEANRVVSLNRKTNRFTNILIAFTKKCPLKCEHCFEWDALNNRETLNLPDIKQIVAKFQDKGTAQIQLTGGEPLMRINDIVEILKSAKSETEFWILSSGYNLTRENAIKLKRAGLTGIVISLDHFDPFLHNQFRHFEKSFEWVQIAVKNAIAVDLVTALSICVTKSFVSDSNLMAYADLAKKMGVSFIQILEPKAVGHFKGLDVAISREQEETLENFYFKMNYDNEYLEYPMVSYHGYHQRKIGCFGSGNRNLYVDTDGDIHSCPFCQKKMGNALADNLDESIERLLVGGCHRFKTCNY